MKLNNKVVLVTGSTRGIGYATAQNLYEHGAIVLLNSQSADDAEIVQQFKDRDRIRFYSADISNPSELTALRDKITSDFGRLDLLVANAGILPQPSGISSITDENINLTIDVNLKGTFNTLKIFGRLIQNTSENGSIVVVSSVDGIIGEPYGVIYSATKAGIISLAKSFARQYSEPLVRVNAVAPGLIDTPLTATTGEDPSDTTSQSIIKRMGTPDEVASTISFLLSDEASFITGQVIAIDGGFTLK